MPGSLIAEAILGLTGVAATVAGFAINMIASAIIAKSFAPDSNQNNTQQDSQNPGSRVQVPPAGDNIINLLDYQTFSEYWLNE